MKKILLDKAIAAKVSASDHTTQLREDLKESAEAAIQESNRDGLLMALRRVGALNQGIQAR